MKEEKKLFLLDAFALIYRAYFAFAGNRVDRHGVRSAGYTMVNSKGQNTSATFGFTNTLLELLEKEKPSHIAVVFDMPGDTHRQVEYTEYKANRAPMPDDLRKQFTINSRFGERLQHSGFRSRRI